MTKSIFSLSTVFWKREVLDIGHDYLEKNYVTFVANNGNFKLIIIMKLL